MTDVSVNHFQNSYSRLQFDLCNFLVCKVSECRPIFVIYSYNHKGYWLEKEGPIAILEKKLSWEILKNPQENTSVWVFFFLKKKRLQYRGFPVNFAEFFEISVFEKPHCNCFWRNPYFLLSCSEVF